MNLATLLRQLQQQHFPSAHAFAKALGVRQSHLSRAMRLRRPQPFDVLGCLKLAEVTGEDPIRILRAAGKGAVADKLERLALPLRKTGASPAKQELLDVIDYLTEDQIRHVTAVLRHIAKVPAGARQRRERDEASNHGAPELIHAEAAAVSIPPTHPAIGVQRR